MGEPMSKRMSGKMMAGIAAGAVSLGVVALPSVASASISKAASFTCIANTAIEFATGNVYGAPKSEAVPAAGAGAVACTYSSTKVKSFVIAVAPLGKSKFSKDVKLESSKDKLTTVHGVGKAATYGHGKSDILFVQQGKTIYEFLDNSGKATQKQLTAIAKVAVPK
jgi:hypothetical protein